MTSIGVVFTNCFMMKILPIIILSAQTLHFRAIIQHLFRDIVSFERSSVVLTTNYQVFHSIINSILYIG